MKHSVLAGALLLAAQVGFGPALAADPVMYPAIPVPENVVPAFDWTGHYIGVQGGYAWGQSNYTNTEVDTREFPGDVNGFFGGVRAGADWQSNGVVWGLFGDAELANIHGTGSDAGAGFISYRTAWFATVGGRVGLPFDNTLLYVLGGLAVAGLEHSWNPDEVTEISFPTQNFDRVERWHRRRAHVRKRLVGLCRAAPLRFRHRSDWVSAGCCGS